MNDGWTTMFTAAAIVLAGTTGLAALGDDAPAAAPTATEVETRSVRVPGTAVSLELVPVPMPAAGDEAPTTLWFLRSEVTWDIYDIFVYRLDLPADDRVGDAAGRPSKPYVPPDRGFGHHGFPAMGMTFDAAVAFCAWLSERTGMAFRLPTEAEWTHACLGGAPTDFHCGADEACLPQVAWFVENADNQTRRVATRQPNAFGLFDMHGNVAEWVVTGERRPIAKGGSYRCPPENLAASARMRQTSAWNASDPQFPKSQWWLADCSWVGFRVVLEDDGGAGGTDGDSGESGDPGDHRD